MYFLIFFHLFRFEEINVPLHIVPPEINSPNTLQKLVEMQYIVFQEDRASYQESLQLPSGYIMPCSIVITMFTLFFNF